ncbi:hypothetical protein ONS95_006470 [Cadophora gregata]|uniref:uncharacterized protein n=1 Tax=Cadophora gregata TaxID=51156 RepID=UPI0026DC03C6|nr:uncharacterized protein ONS95_006470 [Cadophora gregata]KAK0101293.1 hypothetical protein ONS95_006470 [Cadophora gregata]KAK0106697.1 hypothetical protein ONS96_004316 [Cadophora gregata f. sp. sojae]
MQSPILNPARHHHAASQTARRPVVRLRGQSYISGSNSNSNQSSPSPISPKMDCNGEPESSIGQTTSPELSKIMRNSLYLTFNAPRVDDYHRGIFLTYPPAVADASQKYSGTLFHASYAPPFESPNDPPSWFLEEKPSSDVSTATTLVLLFRIGTLDPNSELGSTEEQCSQIRAVLDNVPLGRQNREARLGPLAEGRGNPVLAGYDCIIWAIDAMDALARAKIISMDKLDCTDGAQVMAKARVLAGPADARSMVGVDFGGLKVVN